MYQSDEKRMEDRKSSLSQTYHISVKHGGAGMAATGTDSLMCSDEVTAGRSRMNSAPLKSAK